MRLSRPLVSFAVAFLFVLAGMMPVRATPPETLERVVSVLPVWPGRPQGGTGAPAGAAPEGSGVVLHPDGVIATAWHVIAPAERIDVRLSDGRVLSARVIGHDEASDIALLRVDADLPVFEATPEVALAQPVCAIGNAYGMGLSLGCGVVSAIGVTDAGFNAVEDYVQTDAAVHPGVSGGALVDAEGRLVGMVSAIFASGSDGNIGVNFAVSAGLLMRVTEALLSAERVDYVNPGWRLGLPDRAQLSRLAAARVTDLEADGPAARSGVEVGDMVVRIGPRRIRTPRDAVAALALVAPGDGPVEVLLDRAGAARTVTMSFGAGPADETPGAGAPEDECPHPAPVCQARQAVFPVSSFDPIASATRIGRNLLVTNRHVVGDQAEATVFTPDGPRKAVVVVSAYTGDLALLQVEGMPEGGAVFALEAAGSPADSVFFTVGADIARQEVRVFDPGTLIAGPDPEALLGRLHVTSRMQPGVSGGAVITADGMLAGIAVGGGDGRYEAIPVRDVRALLDLREAETAALAHAKLGVAFAQCAGALDEAQGARPGPEVIDALAEICIAAQNHGQLLDAGRALGRAGAFARAIEVHGLAAEQVPNSINARISLLVSLQLAGRFEDMVPHAHWLAGAAPEDPQALRFAIQSGVWGGDPELAETAYKALLKADPLQAEAARRFIDSAPPAPPRRQ